MTSQVIERKYDRAFEMFDKDGNGVIEKKDFDQLAKSVLLAANVESGSPKGEALVRAYQDCWRTLAKHADADANGQISREEFHRAMAGGFGDRRKLRENFQPVVNADFSVIDADDDGVVTTSELQRYLVALGVTKAEAAKAGQGLDADGDGRISRDEFSAGWADYLLSEDSQASGSALMGAIK